MNDDDIKKLRADLFLIQNRLIEVIKDSRECLHKIERLIGPATRWGSPSLSVAELYDDTPIEKLELSTRSETWLRIGGVKTVGDLMTKTDRELLCTPNIGKASLAEIKEVLEDYNKQRRTSEPT